MSYTIKDNGDSKSPSYGYVVTGYLKSFTKEMKEADGTEPTALDFMEEIQKVIDNAKTLGIRSGVGQVERGQNGTVHWQGYYQFKKKMRFKTFQNKLAKVCDMTWNLMEAQASSEKNVEYCTKPTGNWTYASGLVKHSEQLSEPVWINQNDMVKKKGKRSDLAELNKLIEAGATLDDIDREMPNVALRYDKNIERKIFRRDARIARQSSTEKLCYFLWGDAGTGKTFDVLEYRFPKMFNYTSDDVFILNKGNNGNLWWNGYTNQRVLLIDDIEPGMISRQNLLRILDDLSFKGETKGGVVQTNFEIVFITSNYHPREILTKVNTWYEDDDYGNQRVHKETVFDPALESRFDALCDYTGRENLRARRKQTKTIRMVDDESVASLLPATLEHGTKSAVRQCGSLRVQPSTNDGRQDHSNSKSAKKIQSQVQADSNENLGTIRKGGLV
jgi:hypothetical protein